MLRWHGHVIKIREAMLMWYRYVIEDQREPVKDMEENDEKILCGRGKRHNVQMLWTRYKKR